MKFLKLLALPLLISTLYFGGPQTAPAYATPDTSPTSTKGSIPDTPDPALTFKNGKCADANNCSLVKTYVNPIIKLLSALAILAVVIGIIWGSIQYITAGGDAQRVAAAKGHIQNSLIGLLAFIFLYALLNWLIPGGIL